MFQNSYLPASERCKPQTAKEPTGTYDRTKLLDFLTEQGKNEKDWDHHKSYVPGEKKGKVWQPPMVAKPAQEEEDDFLVSTEWDDILTNANESEIVELAGLSSIERIHRSVKVIVILAILGFTGLINQVQYHAALTDKGLPTNVGGWNGKRTFEREKTTHRLFLLLAAAKGDPLKILPPEPDNTTDVEDCIKRAKANDKDFTRININNVKEVKADVLKELLEALKGNTNVQTLEMAHVGMTDSVGRVRCYSLKTNQSVLLLLFFFSFRSLQSFSKPIQH